MWLCMHVLVCLFVCLLACLFAVLAFAGKCISGNSRRVEKCLQCMPNFSFYRLATGKPAPRSFNSTGASQRGSAS